jgi:hypothetical protein
MPYSLKVVRPRGELSYEQARDLAYLFALLLRWHRLLEACSGDREHALRVWREVARAELASAARRAA